LQVRKLVRHRCKLGLQLRLERRVELEQLARLVDLAYEALVAVEPPAHTRMLGRDPRGLLLVAPEVGVGHESLELCATSRQRSGFKGSHEPSRAGLRAPRAAARVVAGSPAWPSADPNARGPRKAGQGPASRPDGPVRFGPYAPWQRLNF